MSNRNSRMRMTGRVMMAVGLVALTVRADTMWNAAPGTTNDWGIANNWNPTRVPTNNIDVANISNGGTARINPGETFTHLYEIRLGNGGTPANSQLLQTGGTLNLANWLVIGRAMSFTTNLYTMTGGTFNKTGTGSNIEVPEGNSYSNKLGIWSMSGGAVANVLGGNTTVGGGNNAVGFLNIADGAVFNQNVGGVGVNVNGQVNVLTGGVFRATDAYVNLIPGTMTVRGGTYVQVQTNAFCYTTLGNGDGTSPGTFNVLDGGVFCQSLAVLHDKHGAMNVINGTVQQTNVEVRVGYGDNSVASLTVSNGTFNGYYTIDGKSLYVGDSGARSSKGTVVFAGNSLFTLTATGTNSAGNNIVPHLYIGSNSTNDNSVTIKDNTSLVFSRAEMDVGEGSFTSGQLYRHKGTFNMRDNVTFTMSDYFCVGHNGGEGVFNLSGGTFTKGSNGNLELAGTGAGGLATLNQTGGTLVNPGNMVMSRDRGISTYNLSAGTATMGTFYMGYGLITNAVATLNMSGGASLTSGTLFMGYGTNSSATVNMNGGTYTAGDVDLGWLAASASGVTNSTINLNSGTFAVNGINRGPNPDNVSVNFNGGVLKGRMDNANFLNGLAASELHVLGGGAVFDGGGYTLTVSNNLSGAGGLIMQGSGSLVLNGSNTYANGTTINGGAVAFGNAKAVPPTGSVTVNVGGAVGYGFTTVQNLLADARVIFNGGAVALTAANAAEAIDLSGAAFTNTFIGAAGNITYTGSFTPNGSTYRLGGGGTLTFGAAIAGSTNLIISGGSGSKVILTNANTYAGGTLINAGAMLQGSTVSLPSAGGITDNGTLIFDQAANATFSGNISGGGQVVKQNNGMLTLSGANTYAGPTVINAGGLLVSADGKLGTAPGTPVPGSLTINNATYDANGGYQSTAQYTTAGSLLGATGSFTLDSNRGITVGNALGELTVSSGSTLAYSGLVTNAAGAAGGLLVSGPGTLAFSGQCLTPGGMQVNNGTVRLGRADALAGNPLAVGEGLASTVDLNGYSQTIGALAGGATGVITNSAATPVTLTVGAGNATGAFGAAVRQGAGQVSLTKVGTGVLNLNSPSGANAYSGGTTVSAGTLRLGGATEKWVADSLAVGNGSPVPLWTGSLSGRPAVTFNTAPTLSTNALNGHSVVKFNGSNQNLQVLAGDSPMSGASDFTLAVVFRPYAVGLGADGADWYNRTGLLDSEQGGDINDWGFDWSSLQHVGAGRGGYDVAVYSTAASALASAHVALYSKTGNNTTLLVDGEICRQTAGGSSARNKFMFAIGSGSGNNRFLNGDIAEIQIYRTALLGPSLSNTWQRLAYTYGITNAFAPQAVDLIPDSSVVNVASNAVLDLNDQSETVAGLSGAAGASVTLGAGTLTLGGAASPQTFSGSVSGSGGLVKTGDGSQTLSGTNAYSGATAVSGGTLLLAGGSLAGPVTVGAGASFGTAGTATLSLGSGLTINGTLLADVALNGTSDVLNVTGNLALGAASALQIADTGLLAPVKIKYTLITYTGTRTGKFKSSNLPAGWAVLYDADNKRVQVGPSQGTLVMLM